MRGPRIVLIRLSGQPVISVPPSRICPPRIRPLAGNRPRTARAVVVLPEPDSPTRATDRKSTRLNSSHVSISYAVFCLKKKKNNNTTYTLYYNDQRRHDNI